MKLALRQKQLMVGSGSMLYNDLLYRSGVELSEMVKKELACGQSFLQAEGDSGVFEGNSGGFESDSGSFESGSGTGGFESDFSSFDDDYGGFDDDYGGFDDDYSSYQDEAEFMPHEQVGDRKENDLLAELRQEISLFCQTDDEFAAMQYVLCNLNQRGFFIEDWKMAANRYKISLKKFRELMDKLRNLDPVGLGCRDDMEYRLFLCEYYGYDGRCVEYNLVKNCYPLFLKQALNEICRLLDLSRERLAEVIKNLSFLAIRPYPAYGHNIGNTDIKRLELPPDALVFLENDELQIKFLHQPPVIKKNHDRYRRLLRELQEKRDKEGIIRVKEQWQRDSAFIDILNSIQRRFETVLQAVFTYQKDFLRKGHLFFRRLSCRMIEESHEIDEMTVYRLTRFRNVQLPDGLLPDGVCVVPLSRFFMSGLQMVNGETLGQESACAHIKEWVGLESASAPLSDNDMTRLFYGLGVIASREVVKKYRGELCNIPASTIRARYMNRYQLRQGIS